MLQVVIVGFDEKVKMYLDDFAEHDPFFKEKYTTSGKTIKGCCNYVIDIIKKAIQEGGLTKGGGGQVEDDIVYQMAIEYFEEDAIKENTAHAKEAKSSPVQNKESKPKKENKPKKEVDLASPYIQLDIFGEGN